MRRQHAEVREAGVEVGLSTDGDLAALPRGLDLTAYWIVQECLTNVRRSARPGSFGLAGMRERVGEAADGAQAVALATELVPDVALMDIRMPRLDGIEATRRVTQSTGVQVLVLTTYDLEYVFEALRAGASGFLLIDSPPGTLDEAGLRRPGTGPRRRLRSRRPSRTARPGAAPRTAVCCKHPRNRSPPCRQFP